MFFCYKCRCAHKLCNEFCGTLVYVARYEKKKYLSGFCISVYVGRLESSSILVL